MQTRLLFWIMFFSPSLTSNIWDLCHWDFLGSEIFTIWALLTWSREEEREVGILRPGGRPCRPGGRPRAPGGRPGRPGGPLTRLAILAAWPAWAWACSCISLAMSGLWPPPPPPPPEEPIEELRSAIVTWNSLSCCCRSAQLCLYLLSSLNCCGNLLLVFLREERQNLTYDSTHPLHYLRLKIITFIIIFLNLLI